ncbi:MAG: N-acetyltransferase family protein [Pyrinomonadaceae bacterium]
MSVRFVRPEDAEQVARIYNYYVENGHQTFETAPVGAAEMGERISAISEKYPYLVFEENGEVLGYAYAALYKIRQAYRHSAEISVYVKWGVRSRGIGRRLYEKLFEELKETDIHAVIAGISLPNEASVRLHQSFGMEKVAHFREVGYKFGRWIDVGYWEIVMGEK